MKKIALVFICCIPFFVYAQKQNNRWYFGNHVGIDFNSGSPVVDTLGRMSSFEGTAVISDSGGNLLFYTNGGPFDTFLGHFQGGIWNRNHQIMPNGGLDSSGGCNSSAMNCLIIPRPLSDSLYYVFTTDCQENMMQGGFRYSIVDMSLDGGLGAVTSKGTKLLDSVAESVTAVRHANKSDWWVIIHKLYTSQFYAYLVTPSGIQAPVISNAGDPVSHNAGTLAANIEGNKLCYGIVSKTLLFDFNKATGIVSNSMDLNKTSFACAFSANCRYLYTRSNDPPDTKIYQFDLQASDIPGSAKEVASVDTPYRPMQLAPDGKIYVVPGMISTQYLDVINSPDNPDSLVNYQYNALYLGGQFTQASLPNIVTGFYGMCGFNTSNISPEESLSATFSVFPNPAAENINVRFTKSIQENLTIIIHNPMGELIQKTTIRNDRQRIDVSGLAPGLYVLSCYSNISYYGSSSFIVK